MIIFKHIRHLQEHLEKLRLSGCTAGFVPTMGALHAGHISLIKRAKEQTELVISSIFVNPTQFNDPKDFELYPVTLDQDVYELEKAGCDILLLPSVTEIYPNGLTGDAQLYDLGSLETMFDGKYRPGHFQGVCRVVHRLLEIVQPQQLFLGQKDYQQCLVLGRLVQIIGMPVQIVVCPTAREADGLAMSSRNMRLDQAARQKAPLIHKSLVEIRNNLQPGSILPLITKAISDLSAAGFKVDYVAVAGADTLELIEEWDGRARLVILAAAFIGEVRLIDNLLLN